MDCAALHRQLGVHISFVRYIKPGLRSKLFLTPTSSSTVLDSWNDTQLRTIKLGGNAAAASALGVRVGMVPASPAKYDNRASSNYKRQLADLVRRDQLRYVREVV